MARERKFTTEDLYQATEGILLKHSYDGFNFSLLAERLQVSRGAIYKYFDNKDVLITEYMLYEMNKFLTGLEAIETVGGFKEQLHFLIDHMFKNPAIQQLIELGKHVPTHKDKKVQENKRKLEMLHIDMYHNLKNFIKLGRREQVLKESIPDSLVLGYIFQSVAIPNHFEVPHSEWVNSIKEIISHGIFNE